MDIRDYLWSYYLATNGETITDELAEILVRQLAITDGSSRTDGTKWNYRESIEIGNKIGIDFSIIHKGEWFLILNMMYSDYYSVARKYGTIDSMFFGSLALAWFEDVDGEDNKTFRYFFK